MVQTECVENDTKEISSAGLAESLCAPPSPRSFQNLVFYFQTLVFFFKMLVSSVQILAKFQNMAFYFLKFGFLRSGIWEFGATETLILIFFSISTSVDNTKKISRPCIRRHPKSDTEEVSPAGLPSSMRWQDFRSNTKLLSWRCHWSIQSCLHIQSLVSVRMSSTR